MYTFVFLWTPALAPAGERIYHGMIFACFMTASMAGSSLSGILMKRYKVRGGSRRRWRVGVTGGWGRGLRAGGGHGRLGAGGRGGVSYW